MYYIYSPQDYCQLTIKMIDYSDLSIRVYQTLNCERFTCKILELKFLHYPKKFHIISATLNYNSIITYPVILTACITLRHILMLL